MRGRLAVDCRMLGRSGIGTFTENFLHAAVPSGGKWLLVGRRADLGPWEGLPDVEVEHTEVEPFSWREMARFPVGAINRCGAFFSSNYNLPSGVRVPVYSTIHDVLFLDVAGLTGTGLRGVAGLAVRREFLRRAVRLSREVFTVSEFSRGRILHHLGASRPVTVVGNSIPRHIRDHDPATDRGDYIIYVGNIKAHKGLDTLVAAWREARSAGFPHRLMLVGSADNFRTRESSLDVGGDGGVVFTGRLSNTELAEAVARAQFLVQPSRYEGFGIPPLEALWLGVGAVVSDIEPMREIYGELPVTFFRTGDEHDLARKLLGFTATKTDARCEIERRFDARRGAAKILERIGL